MLKSFSIRYEACNGARNVKERQNYLKNNRGPQNMMLKKS
eukprot:UN13326